MLYIVTYATHSERYFEILKQYPGIIILGYGAKWNGFHDKAKAVVEFCKSKNNDDVVCVVDGFDTVILESADSIYAKYKSFNKPLIFSKGATSDSVKSKYIQDKLFGQCNNIRLNAGLYIGTTNSIIELWSQFVDYDDDQTYVTNICNVHKNVAIDTEHILFYNYSPADEIITKENKLYINGNIHSTSIMSAPGNQNINSVLTSLGYTNLPVIKYDLKYRIKTYLKYFLPEIILVGLAIVLYFCISNKILYVLVCVLLLCVFIDYELYIKFLPISNTRKVLLVLVDFLHIGVILMLAYLFFNMECNLIKLLLLNTLALIIITLYTYFKRCILTTLSEKLSESPNTPFANAASRLKYFTNVTQPYRENRIFTKEELAFRWIDGNRVTYTLITLLNIYCLWKIYTNKKCIVIKRTIF